MLYMKLSKDLTVDELMKLVDCGVENIPLRHLIIQLKAKERELKAFGRFFAMLTLEMRMLCVLTEKLLADKILRHFDSITMKMSKSELDKLKLKTTHKRSHKRYTYCSLDFDKWNTRIRAKAVYRIFKILGQLFGKENLYTMWHPFFSRC